MAQEHPHPDQAEAASVEDVRQRFAEELRYTARARSPAVVAAFATVPREHFLGPGPWRVLSPMNPAEYWTTDDDRPHHLYHDILVAIDPMRRLNNGQPSLWAHLYDQLALQTGAHIVHVGADVSQYPDLGHQPAELTQCQRRDNPIFPAHGDRRAGDGR